MKYFSFILFSVVLSSHAQQPQTTATEAAVDKPSKRPSWSQGLPERQTTPSSSITKSIGTSDIKAETSPVVTEPVIDRPVIEIEFEPKSTIEYEVEPVVSDVIDRKAEFEKYYDSEADLTDASQAKVNPLVAAYQWKVLKTTAVEVPESFDDTQPLKVTIQINPKGEVIKVSKADNNLSTAVLKSVEKSMRKWKFEAPADIGLEENISRVFEIDIKT